MKNIVPQTTYQKLVSQISKTYDETNILAKEAVDKIRLNAYWKIGRMIVEVERTHDLEQKLNENLLKQLSEDLIQKYGNGFSVRNLFYMRQFYQAYPALQAPANLSWTHYQLLSTVTDKNDRQDIENTAVKKNWTSRDLKAHLTEKKIDLQPISFEPGTKKLKKQNETNTTPLPIVRGRLNTYKLVASTVPGSAPLQVDCGFGIDRDVPLKGINKPQAGQILEAVKEKDEYVFQNSKGMDKELFTYKAYILRVIDGDTLLCKIDCDFGTWVVARIRLKDIDCPELGTIGGERAKTFVAQLCNQVEFVVLKSYATDVHGRYVADVFYLPGVKDADRVAKEGRLLNQDLINQHLAVRV